MEKTLKPRKIFKNPKMMINKKNPFKLKGFFVSESVNFAKNRKYVYNELVDTGRICNG